MYQYCNSCKEEQRHTIDNKIKEIVCLKCNNKTKHK